MSRNERCGNQTCSHQIKYLGISDLNNDGFVNMADVTKLIDYILGRTQ